MSAEKFFVWEWSSSAGEPSIIVWCKTLKEATKEYERCIKEANENREKNAGTEYGLCHIEAQFTIQKP